MEHDKQWYVDQHRKMWNWISEKIKSEKRVLLIEELKKQWCDSHHLKVVANCFACDYEANRGCANHCLFNWGNQEFCWTGCYEGIYTKCKYSANWKEQSDFARKISNLPVRENV